MFDLLVAQVVGFSPSTLVSFLDILYQAPSTGTDPESPALPYLENACHDSMSKQVRKATDEPEQSEPSARSPREPGTWLLASCLLPFLPTRAIFGSSLVKRLVRDGQPRHSQWERDLPNLSELAHLHADHLHVDSVHDATCQFTFLLMRMDRRIPCRN